MRQWLFDEEAVVTERHIKTAAKLGFEHLAVRFDENLDKISEWCLKHGLGVLPIIADWGNIKEEHPDMAFENDEGLSSFESEDPIVPPNNWPNPWHLEAIELVRGQFRLAAKAVGASLAGYVIGTGHGDATCMSVNWHDYERSSELSQVYWVFGPDALKAYKQMYGSEARPVPHPRDDHDLRTLNFIQVGLIRFMEKIARCALEHDHRIWCMILPFCSNSYLNMACGYAFGMHRRWAQWAHGFALENDADIGFLMPHVLDSGVDYHLAQAAAMADPANLGCACLIGVHNAEHDIRIATEMGMTGILCNPDDLWELQK